MINSYIVAVNISKGGIPKIPQQKVRVNLYGLEGDGHNHEKHQTPLQAVCLQDIEKLEELNQEGYCLFPGMTGENLTVKGVHVNTLPLGTKLQFDHGVILELTKVRKPCYVLDSINTRLKEDIKGRCGLYAKVLHEGSLTEGEKITVILPTIQEASCFI